MAIRFHPFLTPASGVLEVLHDSATALRLGVWASRESLLREWVYVPTGIVAILAACFGVDSLFRIGSVPFPASVACLILLFLGLLLLERLIGHNRTRRLVALVDVPAGWSLRWINVFFVPGFVILPLSPSIGGIEVVKMIAVFVLGFVATMIATAYGTRFLQLLTGSSKRAQTERAEELGQEDDEIPVSETPISETPRAGDSGTESATISAQGSTVALIALAQPQRSQHPFISRDPLGFSEPPSGAQSPRSPMPPQTPLPPPRARLWAAFVKANLDWMLYLFVGVFVGIPVYYASGYAMPLHLCFTVLMYFTAMSLPPKWRQVLHPVIVSAVLTVLGIWILGLIRGQELDPILREYRTGNKYLQLWEGTRSHLLPGAGDFFSTVLDASIVSLALPMYQYRRELREHFVAIIIPNIILSIASLYAYPTVCYAIGISATRSLAFASRSLTLALAIPATANLGGDSNTVTAVALMSGIIGALVGQKMLAMMRIPEDDYVTRGVTLGANSSAVATALLLRTDPRAAALSSLSMSLFGAITVLFTSIPPMTAIIRSLVGL
ncbi:Plastidal glycolate/glycerate translocator 1, chloroplastic [Pleurostoma richardsiae]|uniref:Plastidal glycolate/glycerate translocator 1, chloroplastic n=1 Tax=Pleurostoma richardsiae TaxID=41990 RepID=A0AA38VF28_9PEZI|nr:Plastidal glycolate/glycerate translocator 1, chloroplastic [Pleurostoma richardsiae]